MLKLLETNPAIKAILNKWDTNLSQDVDFELDVLLKEHGMGVETFLNGLGFTMDEYETAILEYLIETGSEGEYGHFIYNDRASAIVARDLIMSKHPDAVITFGDEDEGGICAEGKTGDLLHYLDILQYSIN